MDLDRRKTQLALRYLRDVVAFGKRTRGSPTRALLSSEERSIVLGKIAEKEAELAAMAISSSQQQQQQQQQQHHIRRTRSTLRICGKGRPFAAK